MKADDAKRLKSWSTRTSRLKNIVADQALDIDMLRELNRETSDPEPRRRAVVALPGAFGVTERRACRVVGQARSTQRLAAPGPHRRRARPAGLPPRLLQAPSPLGMAPGRRRSQEGRLAGQPQADPPPLDRRRPACALSRSARSPFAVSARPVGAICPIRPNVVWAMDFQFDQTSDGRMLKFLNVIDEFTREALATDVERSIDADGVVASPRSPGHRARCSGLRALRQRPRVHRPRRGGLVPVQRHRTVVHRSGSPWQNAWIESFNGRMRDEHLNGQRLRQPPRGPGLHRGLADRLQHQQAPQRTRLAHAVEFVEAWLHRQPQPQLA